MKAEWHHEFATYFTEDCQASIGTVDASLGMESRDFKIKRFEGDEIILSGECKFYSTGLQPSDISDIVMKLDSFNTPLNIIACNRLSSPDCLYNFRSTIRNSRLDSISDRICIYYAQKGTVFEMVPIHTGNDLKRSKLFLIIDMTQ